MPITVVGTGDFMPQSEFVSAAEDALVQLCSGDVAFVNLEGPLTDVCSGSDTIARVRGEGRLAEEIGRSGVEVVSLANNHAADFGTAGLLDTMSRLHRAGVATVGAGENIEEAFAPVIVERGGITTAFLGLAATLPAGCAAGSRRPGVAPIHVLSRYVIDPVVVEQNPGMAPYVETLAREEDVELACAAVIRAKQQADVLVVGFHWGVPAGWAPSFQSELADYQRPVARALIDAGADAVIGHHPHELHGIEIHKGRPVFYSLGNFLFHSLVSGDLVATRSYPPYDFASLRSRLGAMTRMQWTEPGAPHRVEVCIVELDDSGNPHPAEASAVAAGAALINSRSARFGVCLASPAGEATAEWLELSELA